MKPIWRAIPKDLERGILPVDPPESGSTAPECPPPWHLAGRGYVLVMRYPEEFLRTCSFLPQASRHSFRGNFGYWMFVDYDTANCGPYRELLFIPGRCEFSGHRYLTISKIFVSTEASAYNGRRNWGIAKERCDFEVTYDAPGQDHVRLRADGKPIAELVFRPFGPPLPMLLNLFPRRWLTLAQNAEGKEFVYSPEVKGRFRLASLKHAWTDPRYLPDIAKGKLLGCFSVPDFTMTFPSAVVNSVMN